MWASKITIVSVCSLSLTGAALAQSAGERPKIATGLWQTQMTTKRLGMPANMPVRTVEYRSCVT